MHKNQNAKQNQSSSLRIVNPDAAGIDIGATSHFVAVPEGRDKEIVREFPCFTSDIQEMIRWLQKCSVKTIVMESTGSYWIPIFEMLDQAGFEVKLVDAHHIKNVRGRKSDVIDCQWLQQLHVHGLLSGAFRPDNDIIELRSYLRQRSMLIETVARHTQHMQKSMIQMNLHLHNVISDITGVTGMAIIRAILKGERDPNALAKMRDYRCTNSVEVIKKSLEGNYREEHLFTLRQAVDAFDFFQAKIKECDEQIKKKLQMKCPEPLDEKKSKRKPKKNEYSFNLTGHLKQILGVDLTAIPGIDASTAIKLISEIGTDITQWPSPKHFCSWLGLCPGTKISGGRRLSGRIKPCRNKAALCLRMAASSLYKSQTAYGAYLRKMKARHGPVQAITGLAHKMARAIYCMLIDRQGFKEMGADFYDNLHKERTLKYLRKRATTLGFTLTELQKTG